MEANEVALPPDDSPFIAVWVPRKIVGKDMDMLVSDIFRCLFESIQWVCV